MQVWPTLTMAALGAVLEVLDPCLASSRTHSPVVGIGEGAACPDPSLQGGGLAPAGADARDRRGAGPGGNAGCPARADGGGALPGGPGAAGAALRGGGGALRGAPTTAAVSSAVRTEYRKKKGGEGVLQ